MRAIAATWGLVVVLGLLAAGADGPPRPGEGDEAEAAPAGLGEEVAAFARERIGTKVGNGECTALAVEALRAAGARRYHRGGPDADYAWGEPLGSFREARPGDVLQFRDAVFTWTTRLPGGGVRRWRAEYPHHTAVVEEVRDRGRTLVVLHQNVGPSDATDDEKKVVRRDTIRPEALRKGGRVWFYRPVAEAEGSKPKEEDGRLK